MVIFKKSKLPHLLFIPVKRVLVLNWKLDLIPCSV